jgi:hypothetical protein
VWVDVRCGDESVGLDDRLDQHRLPAGLVRGAAEDRRLAVSGVDVQAHGR